jgi:uncharacterized membrane-anchored protein
MEVKRRTTEAECQNAEQQNAEFYNIEQWNTKRPNAKLLQHRTPEYQMLLNVDTYFVRTLI